MQRINIYMYLFVRRICPKHSIINIQTRTLFKKKSPVFKSPLTAFWLHPDTYVILEELCHIVTENKNKTKRFSPKLRKNL